MLKETAVNVTYGLYNFFAPRLAPQSLLPNEPFESLRLYFDAIWVLTIPRSIARQDLIRKQFRGLDFEFIPGIDGKTLTETDPRMDLAEARRRSGRSVRINELACTMSHLAMYEKILSLGLKRVLIFEDDAVYLRSRGKWIPYCLSRLPVTWDLFYMGYRHGELRGFQRELQERMGRRNEADEAFTRSVGRGIRTAARHDFTHAYAVSRDGAQKLLQGAYPVSHTADGWLAPRISSGGLNAFISIPKIFSQNPGIGSSIHKD